MSEIIIFSQAPSDIQYVLHLYQLQVNKKNVKIIVVNVRNNFKYLNTLKLNAQIYFIPLVGQKNIFQFIKHVFSLKLIYIKLFSKTFNNKVYFFSPNYDYVTAFLVNKLRLRNTVYFCDIYSIHGPELNSFFLFLKKQISKYFLGFNIKFFMNGSSLAYQFVFSNTDINLFYFKVNNSLIDCFRYKIESNGESKKKSLLLFESNGGLENYFVKYENDLRDVIVYLVDEYNIFVKPHPRLGYSQVLNDYNLTIIEDFIPSELLSTNDFSIVLGIESTAIASVQHPKKFSLINIFEFKKTEIKENFKRYLDNLSKPELIYVDSIKDLQK